MKDLSDFRPTYPPDDAATPPPTENRLSQLVREVLCTGPDDKRTTGDVMPKITEAMLLSVQDDVTISDEAWLAIPQFIRTGMTGNMLLTFVRGVPGA